MLFETVDTALKPWSDDGLWLSVAICALLVLAWVFRGSTGKSRSLCILLAVLVQAVSALGAMAIRLLNHHPLVEKAAVLLAILQSINAGILVALITRASPHGLLESSGVPSDDGMTATLAERQRIAGELHDAVATRLVMLLASVPLQGHPHSNIAQGLQECLLELQMAIDGLNADHVSLGEMFGNLRYRFEPAFKRCGIELQWDVADVHLWAQDDDRVHRELCKIVQEALSNVLRHSGATNAKVRLAGQDSSAALTLEVSDDGLGINEFEMNAVRRPYGHGLRSMRARAQAIDAEFRIASVSPRGLCVSVSMPQTRRVPHFEVLAEDGLIAT